MNDQLLVNERDAAKSLGISAKTLSRLRKAGKIAYVQIGHSVRYAPATIRQWVERTQQTVAAA